MTEKLMAAPDQRYEYYSPAQAAQHALAWCEKNPAWMSISHLPETDCYYVQWGELSEREKRRWETEYAYNEFAHKKRKVEVGFITGKGEFYPEIMHIPLYHNSMMVFRVGVKAAKAFRQARTA